jgi:hypothetical protein
MKQASVDDHVSRALKREPGGAASHSLRSLRRSTQGGDDERRHQALRRSQKGRLEPERAKNDNADHKCRARAAAACDLNAPHFGLRPRLCGWMTKSRTGPSASTPGEGMYFAWNDALSQNDADALLSLYSEDAWFETPLVPAPAWTPIGA